MIEVYMKRILFALIVVCLSSTGLTIAQTDTDKIKSPNPERRGVGVAGLAEIGRYLAPSVKKLVKLPWSIDSRQSVLVTQVDSLKLFTFDDVMQALVRGTTTTKERLFQQWWDTQNPRGRFTST